MIRLSDDYFAAVEQRLIEGAAIALFKKTPFDEGWPTRDAAGAWTGITPPRLRIRLWSEEVKAWLDSFWESQAPLGAAAEVTLKRILREFDDAQPDASPIERLTCPGCGCAGACQGCLAHEIDHDALPCPDCGCRWCGPNQSFIATGAKEGAERLVHACVAVDMQLARKLCGLAFRVATGWVKTTFKLEDASVPFVENLPKIFDCFQRNWKPDSDRAHMALLWLCAIAEHEGVPLAQRIHCQFCGRSLDDTDEHTIKKGDGVCLPTYRTIDGSTSHFIVTDGLEALPLRFSGAGYMSEMWPWPSTMVHIDTVDGPTVGSLADR